MNKKTMIGVVAAVVVVAIVGVFVFLTTNNSQNLENDTNSQNGSNVSDNQTPSTDNGSDSGTTVVGDGDTLVVYFSATGNTEEVANQIAENLGADLFEITPADPYTSEDLNYTDSDSRVSREHDDESLRDVELTTTEVDGWENYDTVFIGYPIWWGVAAWPVDTFVKANDFKDKTVIPFCTSASSSLGQSGELLAAEANGGNWLEGHRFSSNPSSFQIQEFTDSFR